MYIHRFSPEMFSVSRQRQQFMRQYDLYDDIRSVGDRLRWCRYSKGLGQKEAAQIAGVTRAIYIDIECGVTQRMPGEMARRLAAYYEVPVTDFLDEYNLFLLNGQAEQIRANREARGLSQKQYAQKIGMPLSNLREWETGRKTISRNCWERYFKGRV